VLLSSVSFIVTGLVQAGISVLLYFWGQSIAARRSSPWWWWASFTPLLALLLATVGGIGTAVQLVYAFDAANLAPPEDRALVLADGLSHAMNLAALTAVPSWLMYVASLVVFTVGTFLPPVDPVAEGAQTPPGASGPPAG
jgi:hypothetical protein